MRGEDAHGGGKVVPVRAVFRSSFRLEDSAAGVDAAVGVEVDGVVVAEVGAVAVVVDLGDSVAEADLEEEGVDRVGKQPNGCEASVA